MGPNLAIVGRGRLIAGLALSLLLCLRTAAAAPAEAEAKRLTAEGMVAYSVGDFSTAIERYKAAYKLAQKPGLLFNIAQAYRLAGDAKQALFFYRGYLRDVPAPANQAEIEAWIAELEAKLNAPPPGPDAGVTRLPTPAAAAAQSDVGKEVASSPPAPVDRPRAGRPIYKRWWFWAGVGAIAVGTVAVVVATSGGAGAPASDYPTAEVFR